MTKITFLDVGEKYNYFINNNNNLTQFTPFITPKDLDKNNLKKNSNKKSIESLYSHLVNSLIYQSEINAFPSTLPDEINIKFTNLNILEKLNPFNKVSCSN